MESPAPGDERKLVLIIWDIENVRLPEGDLNGLSPSSVVGYLKKHFITDPGRVEYRTLAAVTEVSLNVIQKYQHPNFMVEMEPHCTLLLACARCDNRDADMVLKKELTHFMTEYAPQARSRPGQYTIALVTGDEDYLGPVQEALHAGFSVELLYHGSASLALLAQAYSRPPLLWSEFLRRYSGVRNVPLPYGDEKLLRLLSRGGVLVAGFDRRKGGFGGAERAVRTALQRAVRYGNAMHTTVVDPSNGVLSRQLGVVVSPGPGAVRAAAAGDGLWDYADAERVASQLRGWRWYQGVAVVEPAAVVRVTLQVNESWIPGTSANTASNAAAATGVPHPSDAQPVVASVAGGRGAHQRLADATVLLRERLDSRSDRNGLQQLCRVQLVSAAGHLACTMLYYAAAEAWSGAGRGAAALARGGSGAVHPHLRRAAQGWIRILGEEAVDLDLVGQHGAWVTVGGVLDPEDAGPASGTEEEEGPGEGASGGNPGFLPGSVSESCAAPPGAGLWSGTGPGGGPPAVPLGDPFDGGQGHLPPLVARRPLLAPVGAGRTTGLG